MSLDNSAVVPLIGGAYEIEQSLRFNDDDSAYLSRTPSSAGNRRTFTYSTWIKRSSNGGRQNLFGAGSGYIQTKILALEGTDNSQISLNLYTGSNYFITSTQLLRDMSAWYHIVVAVDTTQATASNRVKVYVNGEQVTDFSDENYPPQNGDTQINNSNGHYLGQTNESGYNFFYDGYMAETHLIDGQQLDPTSFGETGDYGDWKPKAYSGSYGTNGFYLDFGGTYYNDKSGNGNNFTATNLSTTDVVLDSPTNNFATMNPLHDLSMSYYEGNLKLQSTGTNGNTRASIPMTSGKWYWEVYIQSASGTYNHHIGVQYAGAKTGAYDGDDRIILRNDGSVYGATQGTTVISSVTTGDIVGITFDADTNTLQYYKNNSTNGSSFTAPTTDTPYIPHHLQNANSGYAVYNFGQDSSFAGNKTAQGNTDSNSIGDFYYTPPSGYLALCTANLPDPAVIPSENFNTVTWSGNNATSRGITGVGFQPDFTWLKGLSAFRAHELVNVVVGGDSNLLYNLGTYTTQAEDVDLAGNSNGSSAFGAIKQFDSDGFTVRDGNSGRTNVNASGENYVAWNWKCNGSTTSSNTNGTGITSTVSVNSDVGFSIAKYTGTGSSGSTVGHGLSQTPEFVVIKQRNGGGHWAVWHKSFSTGTNIALSSNSRAFTVVNETSNGGISTVNSSVVSFQTGTSDVANVNVYDGTYVMYSWHSVDGYSKVGSYTGNGQTGSPANGTFVYTGFRPAFVLIKCSSDNDDWHGPYDSVRGYYNQKSPLLYANTSGAENVGTNHLDWLSNGFKLRSDNLNQLGRTFIYIAFAENPFKYTNAR